MITVETIQIYSSGPKLSLSKTVLKIDNTYTLFTFDLGRVSTGISLVTLRMEVGTLGMRGIRVGMRVYKSLTGILQDFC